MGQCHYVRGQTYTRKLVGLAEETAQVKVLRRKLYLCEEVIYVVETSERTAITCRACGGLGIVYSPIDGRPYVCPLCNGTGKVRE